ncbi:MULTISPECIES: DMT family transporter [unclassified Campylobacter]|uniref:DMT family transporter n=1 Tax=unclassified Campylobacter TaxID=2593542 RepID=UPI003D35818C
MKMSENKADIGMIFVAIAFGLGYLPTSWAIATNGVFSVLFWRFLLATLIAGAIFLKTLKTASIDDIKFGIILGLFLFVGFVSQTFAFRHAASSSVAFIIGLNVALVPFIASALFKHKIYSYAYIGIILAIIGLYLIGNTQVGFGLGEALALVCATAYSFHIVLTNRFVQNCNLVNMVYFEILTLVFLCAVAIGFFDGENFVPNIDKNFIICMLIVGVLGTAFAFFAQALMQKFTTPIKTAIFFTLEPVTAGVMGYFVGAEHLSSYQILGAGFILLGVLVSEIGSFLKAKNSQHKK